MSKLMAFVLAVGLIAVLALFLMISHLEPEVHDHYKTGDFICVKGLGYFPEFMYEPTDFMVCGDITELDVEGETEGPAPSLPTPEPSHSLDTL